MQQYETQVDVATVWYKSKFRSVSIVLLKLCIDICTLFKLSLLCNYMSFSNKHFSTGYNKRLILFSYEENAYVRSVIDDIISSTKTDCKLHLEETDVFQCTNVRKGPGPEGISGQVLKNCATQLSGIFHSIFQAPLSLHKVPTLWKTSIVPNKSRPPSPNDFRPVALTSHVMKSFEKSSKP